MASAAARDHAGIAGAGLLDVLSELMDPDAPNTDEAKRPEDGRWEIGAETVDVTDPTRGLPEGVTLLAHRARTMSPPPPPAEPERPPIDERISQMPRFRSEGDIHHPTGEHWVAPTQRQLLGRPPA